MLSLKVKAKGFLPTQDLLLLHIIMPSSKRSQSSNGKFYYKQEIKVKPLPDIRQFHVVLLKISSIVKGEKKMRSRTKLSNWSFVWVVAL